MKPDNRDSRAVLQMRRQVADAERKIAILKRDELALTAVWKSVDERIRARLRRNTVADDYTEEGGGGGDETTFSDSKHVE